MTFPDLFNDIITKQTSVIYRFNESQSTVEIVTIFDNRQDPEKLQKEIKNTLGNHSCSAGFAILRNGSGTEHCSTPKIKIYGIKKAPTFQLELYFFRDPTSSP